jgi:hypothetical protein
MVSTKLCLKKRSKIFNWLYSWSKFKNQVVYWYWGSLQSTQITECGSQMMEKIMALVTLILVRKSLDPLTWCKPQNLLDLSRRD